MQTQTKPAGRTSTYSMETARQPEVVTGHSETARIELLATLTDEKFKIAFADLDAKMMKTDKVDAIAIYEKPDGNEISQLISGEVDDRCRFGEDPTQYNWGRETRINDILRDDSPKKQQLLYEWDENVGHVVPKKNVCACFVGLPMCRLDYQGYSARDIRRPTQDIIEFYLQQELLHPGFILGILTNDGKKSGLLLTTKSEKVEKVDEHILKNVGRGESISRDKMLQYMEMSGLVYADVDLTCPKNRDPDRLYQQRVSQAINTLYPIHQQQYTN